MPLKALWSFLFPVGTLPFAVKDTCHFFSSPAITPHFNNSFFRDKMNDSLWPHGLQHDRLPFIGHVWTKPDSSPLLPWSDTLEQRDTQDQSFPERSLEMQNLLIQFPLKSHHLNHSLIKTSFIPDFTKFISIS